MYAIENEYIKEEIKNFRNYWWDGNVSIDPLERREILQKIFLREATENKKQENMEFSVSGRKYQVTHLNGRMEARYEISNPFSLIDREIRVPETKLQLIEILSSIGTKDFKGYEGLFEPFLFVEDEHKHVYPQKNILISTLHRMGFLRRLNYHILLPIRGEYFSLWAMFFYAGHYTKSSSSRH